jgi:putative ABC transport system substrate-binding protein
VKRREFITLVGGAAAWPIVARAQQTTMPIIGFLSTRAPSQDPHLLAAFRQGLKEAGYVEGQNVAIQYRFAENQYDRLRRWRPIWFAVRWRWLPQPGTSRRWRQRG